MKLLSTLLATALLVAPVVAQADDVPLFITPGGWVLTADQRCLSPAEYNAVCQLFHNGTALTDNNIAGITREGILAMHPWISAFIGADGVFTSNLAAEIYS
jgi:hypothetical protein